MKSRSRRPAKCQFCEKIFMARTDGPGKYCSRSCQGRGRASNLLDNVDMSGGPDACWPWTQHTQHFGHGRLTKNKKRLLAHRAVYELLVGPIPRGMCILHHCDNPPCCNPKHLYPGTQKDNSDDMIRRGRAKHPKGEQMPTAHLTDDQAAAIWQRLKAGARGSDLAREYGVSKYVIYDIKRGRGYRHVTVLSEAA